MRYLLALPIAAACVAGLAVFSGCGSSSSPTGTSDGSGSEIVASTVSGAINNTGGSTLGWNETPSFTRKESRLVWLLDELNPVRPAWAATWSCTGGSLSPTFSGSAGDPYTFTPLSCSVTWINKKSASASWNSTFTLNYDSNCDTTHPFIGRQAANCKLTTTTTTGGNTRTITGPDGNSYAITHDTNGASTGWDTTVTPAPTNGGVVITCGASGCASGLTLAVNGSHILGTITPSGGTATKTWDHTVSTGTTPITVTGSGINRVVTGTVTLQHNLVKITSTTTFNSVAYGDPLCCFPTSGSLTTTFNGGTNSGKSETLTFGSASCGEATLAQPNGTTSTLTLQHCI